MLGLAFITLSLMFFLIMKGATLFDPVLIVICLIAAYLLFDARGKFLNLFNNPAKS